MFILNNFIHGNNVDVMIKASKSLEMYALCTEKVLTICRADLIKEIY